MYGIGAVLLSLLLGLGSYMQDTYGDTLMTTSLVRFEQEVYGGFVPITDNRSADYVAYFEKIKLSEQPDTIIILASTNKKSEEGSIVTVRESFKTGYGEIFYDNGLITELGETEFLAVDNDFFEEGDKIDRFIPHVRRSFDNTRIVPIYITSDATLRDQYRFARLLAEVVRKSGKSVLVFGLNDWSGSGIPHVRELQNTTTERVFSNFEFTKVRDLAISSPALVNTALYYFYFSDAKNAHIAYSGEIPFIYYASDGVENPQENSKITLLGFGDVMLDRAVRTLMDRNGMNYPFEKITQGGFMGGVDFVHANLEGPIKEVYVPTSKSIAFRFKPDVIDVIKNAGITIVTIANNHALDQGWGGREDTKKYLQLAGVRYFGHPKNTKEDNAYITKVSGKKIAFIGFDDTIFKLDFPYTAEMIRELDAQADYVIVSIHWGVEYVHQPTQRKVELAHMFVDNGADLVIGHHPHVVQTMEIYNDVPIFYSLGNFVFDQYFSVDTQEGLGFGAILEEGRTVLYLFPYKIPNSQPTLMNEEEKSVFLDKFVSWGSYDTELADAIKSGKIIIERN